MRASEPHQPQPQDLLGCQSPALSSRFDSPETPHGKFKGIGIGKAAKHGEIT